MRFLIIMFVLVLLTNTRNITYNVSISSRQMQYSLVAYCIGIGGIGAHSWQCSPCKKYFTDQVNNVSVFKTGFLNYNVHVYVAYNHVLNEIIIGWAGTEVLSITDWIDDIDILLITYPLAKDCNCKVHQGWWNTYNAIRIPLWQTVMRYSNTFSKPQIRISGHSMGSALATHCSLDGYLNYDVRYDYIYTFGTPRVGDSKFAEYYHQRIPNHVRVVHYKDPVPHIPGQIFGYHHIATEEFYTTQDSNGTHITCNESGEDPLCSNQYGRWKIVNIDDHLHYMGYSLATNTLMCKV
eukprot:107070_1